MKRTKEKSAAYQVLEFAKQAADKKSPVYIGIDPGAAGAIAFRCHNLYCVVDIPTLKVKRGKKNKSAFNLPTILEIFRPIKTQLAAKSFAGMVHAIVEEAQVGIPGKGNSAYIGFRVGCGMCMWGLFLLSMGVSVVEARPSIWKRKMGLTGKDKETSRHTAQGMFPKAPLHRKKDHDRAEALLLAEYLKRIHHGS